MLNNPDAIARHLEWLSIRELVREKYTHKYTHLRSAPLNLVTRKLWAVGDDLFQSWFQWYSI
jgi:hypothetical protein